MSVGIRVTVEQSERMRRTRDNSGNAVIRGLSAKAAKEAGINAIAPALVSYVCQSPGRP